MSRVATGGIGIAYEETDVLRLETHLSSNAVIDASSVLYSITNVNDPTLEDGDDRDGLPTRALEKKHAISDQMTDLDDRIECLQATQDALVDRQVVLRGRVEGFRTRKETTKARYEAARASARVAEAFTASAARWPT